jgi:hypothetical protein
MDATSESPCVDERATTRTFSGESKLWLTAFRTGRLHDFAGAVSERCRQTVAFCPWAIQQKGRVATEMSLAARYGFQLLQRLMRKIVRLNLLNRRPVGVAPINTAAIALKPDCLRVTHMHS